jgi:hypothetical protein
VRSIEWIFLVLGKIMCFEAVTAHWSLHVVVFECSIALLDALYGELSSLINVPAEFVTWLKIELSTEVHRDRDRSSLTDLGFCRDLFG